MNMIVNMIAANDSTNEERARYWMEKARQEVRANRDPGGHLNYALHCIIQDGKSLEAANTNDEEVTFLTKAALIFNGKSDMEKARVEVDMDEQFAHLSSAVTRAVRLGRIIAPHLDDEGQLQAGLAAIGASEEEISSLNGTPVSFMSVENRMEA